MSKSPDLPSGPHIPIIRPPLTTAVLLPMITLDFEKPVADLEAKIEELRHISDGGRVNIADEIGNLQEKVDKQLRGIYGKLSPAQKVQVARHPDRPHGLDYINALAEDFTSLAGDRLYGEDLAI